MEVAATEWIHAGTTVAVFRVPEDETAGQMTTEDRDRGAMTGPVADEDEEAPVADRGRAVFLIKKPGATNGAGRERVKHWILRSRVRLISIAIAQFRHANLGKSLKAPGILYPGARGYGFQPLRGATERLLMQ